MKRPVDRLVGKALWYRAGIVVPAIADSHERIDLVRFSDRAPRNTLERNALNGVVFL
jgi:hypothetical protein